MNKGVGKGEGGAEAPPDFKLKLLCVQAFTAKARTSKIYYYRKTREGKTAFRL